MNCFGPAWRDSDRPGDRGRRCDASTLLGGSGDNGIIARLMLKPGHIIIEHRPDAPIVRLGSRAVKLSVSICLPNYLRQRTLSGAPRASRLPDMRVLWRRGARRTLFKPSTRSSEACATSSLILGWSPLGDASENRAVCRVCNRHILDGNLWVIAFGPTLGDLPQNFGPYTTCSNTTCSNRFVR